MACKNDARKRMMEKGPLMQETEGKIIGILFLSRQPTERLVLYSRPDSSFIETGKKAER